MKFSGQLSEVTTQHSMAIAKRFIMKDGQLTFFGEVKRPSKFRPAPLVDHIMSNIDDHEEQKSVETSGLVTLRVPSDPNAPNGTRPLDINLNGKNYSLPRDASATVPKEIADIVLNAQSSVSVVPIARGEKVVCQVDPATGTYMNGKGMTKVENRRFNVIVEDVEG